MVCESYQLSHKTFINEAFSIQALPALETARGFLFVFTYTYIAFDLSEQVFVFILPLTCRIVKVQCRI